MTIWFIISIILNVLLLFLLLRILATNFIGTIYVDGQEAYMQFNDEKSLEHKVGIVNIKKIEVRSDDKYYNEKED